MCALACAPQADVDKICSALGITCESSGYFTSIDCSKIASLPSISFTIAGTVFAIPPQSYVIQASDGCLLGFVGSDSTDSPAWCVPNQWVGNGVVVTLQPCLRSLHAPPAFISLPRLHASLMTRRGSLNTAVPRCRILGDPFLGALHTVYDFGNKQIGFAYSK